MAWSVISKKASISKMVHKEGNDCDNAGNRHKLHLEGFRHRPDAFMESNLLFHLECSSECSLQVLRGEEIVMCCICVGGGGWSFVLAAWLAYT